MELLRHLANSGEMSDEDRSDDNDDESESESSQEMSSSMESRGDMGEGHDGSLMALLQHALHGHPVADDILNAVTTYVITFSMLHVNIAIIHDDNIRKCMHALLA